MIVWSSLALVWAATALAMAAAWWWQQRRENAGIVDVVWAASLGCSAVLVAVLGTGAVLPRLLLAAV